MTICLYAALRVTLCVCLYMCEMQTRSFAYCILPNGQFHIHSPLSPFCRYHAASALSSLSIHAIILCTRHLHTRHISTNIQTHKHTNTNGQSNYTQITRSSSCSIPVAHAATCINTHTNVHISWQYIRIGANTAATQAIALMHYKTYTYTHKLIQTCIRSCHP